MKACLPGPFAPHLCLADAERLGSLGMRCKSHHLVDWLSCLDLYTWFLFDLRFFPQSAKLPPPLVDTKREFPRAWCVAAAPHAHGFSPERAPRPPMGSESPARAPWRKYAGARRGAGGAKLPPPTSRY